MGIESDIIKQQRVRNKNNDFSTEISYAKRTEKMEIEAIMDDVRENDQNDTKGWVREKGEFMLGLCEQCIGDSLNSRQKSIIDRCVRKLYIDVNANLRLRKLCV